MKKKIIIGIGLFFVLLILLSGFVFLMNTFFFQEPSKSEKTEQTSRIENEQVILSTEQEKQEEPTLDKQKQVEVMLADFGKKWVNYETVYKRNQSVVNYFTEEAKKTYGLTVDPRADFDGSGTIKTIYQATDNKNAYVLIGEEKARGAVNEIFIEATVDMEQGKIQSLGVHYARQAY